MTRRMLIDATHPEETRVVVLSGNRLEEFDFETSTKKQIKGNIYLAKITRVEPSLQAAFVEYGGNRHGFLSFSEIHPDYYRLPVADRRALLAEEAAASDAAGGEKAAPAATGGNGADGDGERGDGGKPDGGATLLDDASLETVGGDDMDDVESHQRKIARRYKIQEVVSRRQIMLVQVVKEERGTKGAALTTYISLAGRYCVLMPNTPRRGGISRRITNPSDRKRLRGMMDELSIPQGMAVILRTAGMERSKAEIKRDYEYLLKNWNQIREVTLQSKAPAMIYEEGDLIKRSLRDLYTRDIDEILVDGEAGYRAAKTFMRQLIPSHAKRVQPYRESGHPMFYRYQLEGQIDNIHNPEVQLKSGGYIVINATEALVAIDVNSGRATRERHIEETALKTNVEAAEEIARQLRLRDLAGLIVIDFIDMEEARNRSRVEKRLKEAMRLDRARIQLGRISPFGLLELSRQRLRPSLLEASTERCPTCGGMGHVRSTESTVLQALRTIEEEAMRKRDRDLTVFAPTAVAFYLLNQKRHAIAEIESRYRFRVTVAADDTLMPPGVRIERTTPASAEEIPAGPAAVEAAGPPVEMEDAEAEEPRAADGKGRRRRSRRRRKIEDGGSDETEAAVTAEAVEAEAPVTAEAALTAEAEAEDGAPESDALAEPAPSPAETEGARPARRRGRRGGRRRSRRGARAEAEAGTGPEAEVEAGTGLEAEADGSAATDRPPERDAAAADDTVDEAPKRRRRTRRRAPSRTEPTETTESTESTEAAEAEVEVETAVAAPPADDVEPTRKPRRRWPKGDNGSGAEPAHPGAAAEAEAATIDAGADEPAAPAHEPDEGERRPAQDGPRRGWWQRLVE